MAPQYVKPFVKRNKNDAADAEAICDAVVRPNIPAVPIKNIDQQAMLSVHRARQGFVKARAAQANQIRGLLADYSIAIPKGIAHITKRVPEILEDGANELPGNFRLLIQCLVDHLKELDRQEGELELEIKRWHRENDDNRKLADIPGVGPMTASAVVATVGDTKNFKNGRQISAWQGIVPRQRSTGGKSTLLGISKRGDTYLRTLLIHGARAVIRAVENKPDADPWIKKLLARHNKNIAAATLANKNPRTIWALLTHDRAYEATYRMAASTALLASGYRVSSGKRCHGEPCGVAGQTQLTSKEKPPPIAKAIMM